MSIVNVPDVAQRLEPAHINHQVQLGTSTFTDAGTPHTDFQSTQGPQVDKFTAYHNGSNSVSFFTCLKCLLHFFSLFARDHCQQ